MRYPDIKADIFLSGSIPFTFLSVNIRASDAITAIIVIATEKIHAGAEP